MYGARMARIESKNDLIYSGPRCPYRKGNRGGRGEAGRTNRGGRFWVSPDGSRAVSVVDNRERLWDTVTGKELTELGGFEIPAHVLFSQDGDRVVPVVNRSRLTTWDARTGQILLESPTASAFPMAFSRNGRWLATVAGVWELPRCQELIDKARASLSRQLSDADRDKYFLRPPESSLAQRVYESVRPFIAGLLPQMAITDANSRPNRGVDTAA